jgi:aspartyl-tRNA(Asn)/glutamyl-tRNA(Gln) amidotransferase subunit A
VAVKDVILTKGLRTTCGSKLLAEYVPPYDATAIVRLEEAGGVILGKTNCDEFAMGSSNENSAFGPVRNPLAPDRVPGGSSGGSAAAVAQGTAVAGAGVGHRRVHPATRFVLRRGGGDAHLRARLALRADRLRQLARPHWAAGAHRARCRRAAAGIAGRDPLDATSADAPVPDYTQSMDGNVQGLKLGLPREYLKDLTSETGDLIAAGVATLRKLGCEVREISLPATDYAIGCYYIIATAEASSNLARYDGVRYTFRSEASGTLSDMYRHTRGEGFGAECKRRIMLGTYVLSAGYYDAYYLKAQKVRALIARISRGRFRKWTRSWRRCRPSRRLSWARRSTIRWPCTYRIFTRLPARWPAFPA